MRVTNGTGGARWVMAAACTAALVSAGCGRSPLLDPFAPSPDVPPARERGVANPRPAPPANPPPPDNPPPPPPPFIGPPVAPPPTPPSTAIADCVREAGGSPGWPVVGHDPRASANFPAPRPTDDQLAAMRSAWRIELEPNQNSDPLSANGRLVVSHFRDPEPGEAPFATNSHKRVDWRVHNIWTGEVLCELPLGLPLVPDRPTGFAPALADGLLFSRFDDIMSGESMLGAFQMDDGAMRWQTLPFAEAAWPLVVGDLVLGTEGSTDNFVPSSPRTVAVDIRTGSFVWDVVGTSPDGLDCSAADASVSADVVWRRVAVRSECAPLTGGFMRTLHVHDLATGAELWGYRDPEARNPRGFSSSTVGPLPLLLSRSLIPGAAGPLLFVGGGRRLVGEAMAQRDMLAFDADTGEVVWQTPAHTDGILRNSFSHRAVAGDRVVIAANAAPLGDPSVASGLTRCDGDRLGCVPGEPIGAVLSGLDPATGDVEWSLDLPALVTANLAGAGPLVFAALADELWVVDARDGRVPARFALDELLQPAPPPGSAPVGALLVDDGVLILHVANATVGALYGLVIPAAADGADAGTE